MQNFSLLYSLIYIYIYTFHVYLTTHIFLFIFISFLVLTVPGYDVRVNRLPVVEGCNAVLSCTAREDVKEHLTVTSWYRDDAILLPGSIDTGKKKKKLLY